MFRPISWLPSFSELTLITICVLGIAQSASGGTFAPDKDTPLTEQQIKRLGRATLEGRIYSGDVIYYADRLIKSGVRANRWPGGILYFEVDPSVTASQKAAFVQACQAWSANTPVTCVERNGEPNYVYVATHNGEECGQKKTSCSYIGMSKGKQDFFIYIDQWQDARAIQHEIGHAFGLIHEQQRPDRDNFVSIAWGNIDEKNRSNFDILSVTTVTEYDFESIMHYGNCSFSNKPCDPNAPTESASTIFPKACNRTLVGGVSITPLDIDGMRAAYLPQIAGLYAKSRRPACGVHNLSPEQISSICGSSNCSQASPISFNRKEDFHHEECSGGFVTDPESFKTCPSKKTLLSSSSNSATFACGTGNPETKYYWDWSCGCAQQSLEKLCTNVEDEFDAAFYNKLRKSTDTRDIATVRYLDQIAGWKKLGLIEEPTSKAVGKLLIKNYLKKSFDERLYSVLCNMRIMIELNLYTKRNYILKHVDFQKLARAEGLTL
ncbi:M12 family metallopeptidase [Pseudomonas arsenicoxydans]|uniref:Peptidase M12A domain-containing protein n=1 Tax=Pseudomonas arsenicoxydans TaxID=702115 RepID=A0A4P6G8K6_9PSED|nr:M12 family metallopeptidase [Pseudomonas arsenicoxydans]QAY87993.1 hypothetical protein CUN61_30370 [Pseudomonas arsenicoxydans]